MQQFYSFLGMLYTVPDKTMTIVMLFVEGFLSFDYFERGVPEDTEVYQQVRSIIRCYFVFHSFYVALLILNKHMQSINSLRIIMNASIFFLNVVLTIWSFSTVALFNLKAAEIGDVISPKISYFSSLSLRRSLIILEVCSFLASMLTVISYLIYASASS